MEINKEFHDVDGILSSITAYAGTAKDNFRDTSALSKEDIEKLINENKLLMEKIERSAVTTSKKLYDLKMEIYPMVRILQLIKERSGDGEYLLDFKVLSEGTQILKYLQTKG